MDHSRPLYRNYTPIMNQVLTAMLKNQPFDSKLAASATSTIDSQTWTSDSVSQVLSSIPRFFFQSPRSIGRQTGFRHRAPLKQRNLKQESWRFHNGVLVLGPAAHRDLDKVKLGLDRALEFYYWVETHFGFAHNERTCREMALVLARGNRLKTLWDFLKDMSKRGSGGLVTTQTVTCLIKVLGEEGLSWEL